MSRYIDADKLIQEFEKNIVTYESNEFEEGTNAGIRWCTEDVANAPTVKAIPIEWIAKWMGKHQGLEYDGWNLAVGTMVKDWEKENEQSDANN